MTKYIGPKTADENVATQADKLSLSSATPDALTPDQAGAAGTATTAARSDHQHEILAGAAGTILPDDAAAEGASTSFARADHTHAITAAAPSANLTASTTNSEGTASSFARSDHSHAITTGVAGTITGTNAEGTSTSFARADHNHAFGSKSVPASALALGPTYETSLPSSPVDGQEIYYAADATNGVIWHLRYRSGSSSSYKWEFIGGADLYTSSDSNSTFNNNWTALTGTITLPLAGDYSVDYGAFLYGNSSTKRVTLLKAAVATPTNNTQGITTRITDDVPLEHASRIISITGVSASATLRIYGKNDTTSDTCNSEQRHLAARPVRVG